MPRSVRRSALAQRLGIVIVAFACGGLPADAQNTPYDPYADSHDPLPPVAADGTLHWGTFYKSAAIQKTY